MLVSSRGDGALMRREIQLFLPIAFFDLSLLPPRIASQSNPLSSSSRHVCLCEGCPSRRNSCSRCTSPEVVSFSLSLPVFHRSGDEAVIGCTPAAFTGQNLQLKAQVVLADPIEACTPLMMGLNSTNPYNGGHPPIIYHGKSVHCALLSFRLPGEPRVALSPLPGLQSLSTRAR